MAEVSEVIELKTCPFCGGKPLLQQNGVTTKYWEVVCIECDLIGMAHSTNIEASAWWNRRAPDPERDELREALSEIAAFKGQTLISVEHGQPYSVGANAAFEEAVAIAVSALAGKGVKG